jgi:hypothetical protein
MALFVIVKRDDDPGDAGNGGAPGAPQRFRRAKG